MLRTTIKANRVVVALILWLNVILLATAPQVHAEVNCAPFTNGEVQNYSSSSIKIKWDNPANVYHEGWLGSGQNSSSVFCDIDDLTMTTGSFKVYRSDYYAWLYYSANSWHHIGARVIRCYNSSGGYVLECYQ